MESTPVNYIYCVVPAGWSRIKIGYTTATPLGLWNRYVTSYGADMDLLVYPVPDGWQAERVVHTALTDVHIINELFNACALHRFTALAAVLATGPRGVYNKQRPPAPPRPPRPPTPTSSEEGQVAESYVCRRCRVDKPSNAFGKDRTRPGSRC